MTDIVPTEWSPADNPYAIAVSEAYWAQLAVTLAIHRIRDGDDRRVPFSSRQIDARQLVFALRQLLTAEQLEQKALGELGIDPVAGEALAQARQQFGDALPDIKHMRDALIHFDEWSRGRGHGPQKQRLQAGEEPRDVARRYWGFGYNLNTDTISLGPYAVHVDTAGKAAVELSRAINTAAREVDKRDTAHLRSKTIQALTRADVSCKPPANVIMVSPGDLDLRIWLSLNTEVDSDEHARQHLAARVITALGSAGLQLVSLAQPQLQDVSKRLVRGDPLQVESVAAPASQASGSPSPVGWLSTDRD